jgi:hypothetical protein
MEVMIMLGIGLVICVAMFVGMFVVGGLTVEIRSERLQRTVQTDQGGGQNRGEQPQVMRGGGDAVGTDTGLGYEEKTEKEKREP